MDDVSQNAGEKSLEQRCQQSCRDVVALQERLQCLLLEAADVQVQLGRADGTIQGVPHYSVIEERAHELGRQLSRQVQERQMGELIDFQIPKAPCPKCGTRCELIRKKRPCSSIDGELDLPELVGRCPFCRKSFFPAADHTRV